jgi:ABC-type sugar transport system ATPase subunit
LLDEPLSNLDALLRISMRSELKRIQRRLQVTTVYVTHDQTEAMSLGDRIAVMKDGRVMQTGTPEEIYRDPNNEFVGRFVGTPPMNILDGPVAATICDALGTPIERDLTKIIIGVRPEHLAVVGKNDGALIGKLVLTGIQGDDRILYVNVDDREIVVRATSEVHLAEGDVVGIRIEKDHLYFFDKGNGARIR